MRIKGVWELVAWRAWLGERTYAAVGGRCSSGTNQGSGRPQRGVESPPPRSPWAPRFRDAPELPYPSAGATFPVWSHRVDAGAGLSLQKAEEEHRLSSNPRG